VALRVSEISKRLDVSEMTVYRDIKPLIEQQKVLKTVNGITLVPQIETDILLVPPSPRSKVCHKNSSII
jgi:DeoR/GlpR family transcriptional regulator of sugar metabolism